MERWQERLLPWMIILLMTSSLLFGGATIIQYNRIYRWMTTIEEKVDDRMWNASAVTATSFREQLELANARAAYSLEHEQIRRSYQNTRQLVALGLWARFMGFLVGAILALVGSAFVLGKLNDQGNELSGEQSSLKISLKTASPGIVLATLGTILIGISLVANVTISNEITPTYFPPSGGYRPSSMPSVKEDPAASIEAPPVVDATGADRN